jgi:hypothetical protein
MSVHLPNERRELLIGAAVFGAIGAALIVLAPTNKFAERASCGV